MNPKKPALIRPKPPTPTSEDIPVAIPPKPPKLEIVQIKSARTETQEVKEVKPSEKTGESLAQKPTDKINPKPGRVIEKWSEQGEGRTERREKPAKVERIKPQLFDSCQNWKTGDSIALPYSHQTVTITHFYQTLKGDWYAVFEGGGVRVAALK